MVSDSQLSLEAHQTAMATLHWGMVAVRLEYDKAIIFQHQIGEGVVCTKESSGKVEKTSQEEMSGNCVECHPIIKF